MGNSKIDIIEESMNSAYQLPVPVKGYELKAVMVTTEHDIKHTKVLALFLTLTSNIGSDSATLIKHNIQPMDYETYKMLCEMLSHVRVWKKKESCVEFVEKYHIYRHNTVFLSNENPLKDVQSIIKLLEL